MREMTSRERMLTALHGGQPDRVPASVHQWLPYHLTHYMGGATDIESFRRFGLDAAISRGPQIDPHDPNWVVERVPIPAPPDEERWEVTVTTPGGQLQHLFGRNEHSDWNITHLVKKHEDLELIDKYMPAPDFDWEAMRADKEELGPDGILRTGVWGEQAGCWQHAVCLMGTQELIMEAIDNPDWVHEFLTVLWKKKEKWIERNMDGTADIADLVETGGGAASSTVISPAMFREFCLPYDQKMHRALHAHGHTVVYHTCGGMMPILDLIVQTECDASETLTPPSMGGNARPRELKERIGKKVALIGGLDQNHVLEKGTREDIFRHVHEMFEGYGPGGGYIMSPSDHFFDIPLENLEAYAAAARECVYTDTAPEPLPAAAAVPTV